MYVFISCKYGSALPKLFCNSFKIFKKVGISFRRMDEIHIVKVTLERVESILLYFLFKNFFHIESGHGASLAHLM